MASGDSPWRRSTGFASTVRPATGFGSTVDPRLNRSEALHAFADTNSSGAFQLRPRPPAPWPRQEDLAVEESLYESRRREVSFVV